MWHLLVELAVAGAPTIAEANAAPFAACTAHVEGALRLPQWRVDVRDGLVFRANSGVYLGDVQPPLFAIANDGLGAHAVRSGQRAARKPAATLDPATLTLLGGRGPLRATGGVDLERGVAWFGAHTVVLEGRCTASDALLAVLGSRSLRAPG